MQSDNDSEFSRVLREKMAIHKAPDQLRRRIAASLDEERRPAFAKRLSVFARSLGHQWRSLSAAAVCGAAAMFLATHLLTLNTSNDSLLQQVMTSHNRALMTNRMVDVMSSDQHTVKPWFAGKIDYSPRVKDFATNGFELAGGRVDYLNNRTVAALVYKRRLHVITVYSWPTPGADSAISKLTRHGINMVEWTDRGMQYYAVSDIELGELNELAQLITAKRE